VNEFFEEAKQAGVTVFAAGDAREIAEASSAMFIGKIAGLEIGVLSVSLRRPGSGDQITKTNP
jgi:hypothetical protein